MTRAEASFTWRTAAKVGLDSIGAEIFDKNPIKISDWDQIIVFLSDL